MAPTGKTDLLPAEISKSLTLGNDPVPEILQRAGAASVYAAEEFFYGKIRNQNTRLAYQRSVYRFLAWLEVKGIRELHQVTPRMIADFLDGCPSRSTRRLQLSAIRHFFDEQVVRHAMILNPALSVRGERETVVEGRTPEATKEDVRKLFTSLDHGNVVGLRDRAIIGILVYTAVRIGAAAKLKRGDFFFAGNQYNLRFTEKGGKLREIPVRSDLEDFLLQYLRGAGLEHASKETPLFQSTIRREKKLTGKPMHVNDISRMVKRRIEDAGIQARISGHSFRVATITDLLEQGVPLEDVQYLAGHADPRTTRLYDRRQKRVTRNIVERISL